MNELLAKRDSLRRCISELEASKLPVMLLADRYKMAALLAADLLCDTINQIEHEHNLRGKFNGESV